MFLKKPVICFCGESNGCSSCKFDTQLHMQFTNCVLYLLWMYYNYTQYTVPINNGKPF